MRFKCKWTPEQREAVLEKHRAVPSLSNSQLARQVLGDPFAATSVRRWLRDAPKTSPKTSSTRDPRSIPRPDEVSGMPMAKVDELLCWAERVSREAHAAGDLASASKFATLILACLKERERRIPLPPPDLDLSPQVIAAGKAFQTKFTAVLNAIIASRK